ncbi:MAG TPA: aldo/keto reductase [Kiritimatiellia bacterium]|mgnify:CR=1 FL=1|nr:aldo/keto reductase [Kiritimatiellia bacterium]
MESRAYGKSGFQVSVVGLGAGHIGSEHADDKAVDQLLNGALDAGVTLIDTARGYGLSEERIGRFISHRRREFILSTKVGYGVNGIPDWTPAVISAGITNALKLLKTDYLDIVHLHSCPLDVLKNSDLVNELQNEVTKGRIRVAAYSGENDALTYAVHSGAFGGLQCSVNIADQRSTDTILPAAGRAGMGIIAKRPLANMAWRFKDRPTGEYAETYWTRLQEMKLDPTPFSWTEMALRFAMAIPDVHSCIVGTSNLEHLLKNIEIANRGKLPERMFHHIRKAFVAHDRGWMGEV